VQQFRFPVVAPSGGNAEEDVVQTWERSLGGDRGKEESRFRGHSERSVWNSKGKREKEVEGAAIVDEKCSPSVGTTPAAP